MSGFFVSFEGIEGAGKSTVLKEVARELRKRGYQVIETFEPGDTPVGKALRQTLLAPEHSKMHYVTEVFLYFADRAEHVQKVILPALEAEKVVLTDRYSDSTFSYQGYGRGLGLEMLETLNQIATNGLMPDLTILLDLDVKEGLRRNKKLQKNDRFELETLEFHEKVRRGFLELAEKNPKRFRIIDASMPLNDVIQEALNHIVTALEENNG
ncbi:MAG: dTMP kinase [Nitrospirae bacterium]|nr:dTMP kinase [Nitrospirota bacterium]